MLPETGELLVQEFKVRKQPSKTFRLDFDRYCVTGMTDGLEAVKQAVICILNTERFEWLIYSWIYGTELTNLFGKPMGLIKAKLKKRLKEALLQDDRIKDVTHFAFEENGRTLNVKFTVQTLMGEIEAEKEVRI